MRAFFLVVSVLIALLRTSAAEWPKARLLSAVRPMKTPDASARHLAGAGIFVVHMDLASGRVSRIDIPKSTGHALLDKSAVGALRKWRAAPGTVRVIKMPVVFRPHEDGAYFE